ncbi:MAG: DNA-3-methyladenine glycosylase family protein [Phycisphaerales bacterium JB052]
MPGSTITIKVRGDFHLARDVCSYGYFVLMPNYWDVGSQTLSRVLSFEAGPSACVIDQRSNDSLRARFDRRLDRSEQSTARSQIARMLNLEMNADEIRDFHRVDPRWKKSGRARLFRSPTLFEDVIKTVTSCNVAWPNTVNMNRRLCEVCGGKSASGAYSFPSARKLSRTRVGTLRGRCRVGYRDQRIVDLAKLFVKGHVDERWLSDPATDDDEVYGFLLTLPGIGPYAAGNIMQLLGRYSRLAIDTETIRHAKKVLGYSGSDAQITKQIRAHYEPFGEHKFRSYWFELWRFYETKAGPSHTWEREQVSTTFTAANL